MNSERRKPRFTPPPWTIAQRDWADGYGFWWEILAKDANTTVCELADTALPDIAWQSNPMGEIPPAENLMNAHLVSSAPDLYLALVACVDVLESIPATTEKEKQALDSARRALQKADGL